MPKIDSGGVAIAYEDLGEGTPIVLVHGFASERRNNWQEPRWFETLTNAGRRVVALDCRGHGESDKPHDPAAYAVELVIGDVLHLMDHLGIERADLMGYSIGSRISATLLARHGERFGAAVLGGVGGGLVGDFRGAEAIARALDAADAASVQEPSAKAFRSFAEQRRNDLRALAACMRGLPPSITAGELASIFNPVLVVAGAKDTLIGDPRRLAELIPGAQLVIVPDRDHLNAVGARLYKEAVMAFLAEQGGRF